ncbi:MAG: hypothetical protein BM555_05795 [Crocinitomix sp. MedPE-SWsnd]|nr:MAG: hypothetical protein BM555_05795 [Crocinitomix sp. MedPE-SWsnd]
MKLFSLSLLILISTIGFAQKKPKQQEVKAVIKLDQSINKAGNVMPGEGDYYLIYNEESYFVKLSEGKVSREQLKAVLGTKTTFEVIFDNGLWDTDDPNVQSRIGNYVGIINIHTP